MAAQQTQQVEDWGTSAEDALRVSLISADVKKGNEVKKWNLDETVNAKKNAYSVIDANPYDVSPAPEYEEKVPVVEAIIPTLAQQDCPQEFETTKTIVGIYAPEDDYADALVDALSHLHEELQFIRYEESNATHFSESAIKSSAFVIHMTDEDESALLDQLIDEHGDKSTLFLCESSVSDKCIAKVEEFLSSNQID